MLFRAGLVSRESLDSKSPKLAAQGVGAELGDPAGAHLPAFLPPVPHTPLQAGRGGNCNARIHWRLFPAFTSPEHPSVPGQGSWTLAGVRGGTHPQCRAVPPPQWEGRRGAAACFGVRGGQCLIPAIHKDHQQWGCVVAWYHAPRGAAPGAAGDAHESLSLLLCHWLFSSVRHQLLGQKFRWQMLPGKRKHFPAPTRCGTMPISPQLDRSATVC